MRDIGALFPTLNRDRYRQFVQVLSQSSGSILNNANLARTLGVSEPTIRDWLRIAHDTFLWRHLPAWNRSLAKQVVKHPKGLLRDSGLLHRLLRIATPELLDTHPLLGNSWEGMVIELLLRGFENHGIRVNGSHFRTRGGAEIDLILEGDFGVTSGRGQAHHLDQPTRSSGLAGVCAGVQVSAGADHPRDEQPRQLEERILVVPVGSL